MATLQGQVNSVNISDRIYQNIMNVSSNRRRPLSNRAQSAKSYCTQISFDGSPRNSARSKSSQCSQKGVYSDFDIIRNRSWSGSKVKNTQFGKGGVKGGDSASRSLLSPTLTDSRTALSSANTLGGLSARGENKGRQLQTPENWNRKGAQVQRLHQEWAAIEHCRAMKRASEMVQHRLDPMYRLSGSTIPLVARYQVNDTELQRLREMSETSRVLQLDLKRIKYPMGYHSSRLDRSTYSKNRVKVGSQSERTGAKEGGGTERGSRQEGEDTTPDSEPTNQPPGDQQHPSSPISTPEQTPRLPDAEGQGTATEEGEASQAGETSQAEESPSV